MHQMDLHEIDLLACCTVCGTQFADDLPWGATGDEPSFHICQRCGVEWGRQDAEADCLLAYRAAWLERGGLPIDAMVPDDGLDAEQRIERMLAALDAREALAA